MIQPNSKIEKFNGIRFFEQDIMFDDFVYNDYAELTLTVDYCVPGFGIVLINSTNPSLSSDCEAILFRIGSKEASIEYKSGSIIKTITTIPTTIVPSMNNIVTVKFEKNRNNIYFTVNDSAIITPRVYKLPKTMNKYCLGIYSNAGNSIKEIYSNSKIPDYWNINMYNTIGGRIVFVDNGFTISECIEKAEVEQFQIHLTPNTYYLRYDKSEGSDIKCYAFYSNDSSTSDEEKNILLEDNTIIVDTECDVNIKFVGTIGTISNIILNVDKDSKYVATVDSDSNVEESSIVVYKNDISKVEFTAIVSSAYPEDSYVFKEDDTVLALDSDIPANTTLDYEYIIESNTLNVYNNGMLLSSTTATNPQDQFIIFNNVDAVISSFSITKNNNDVINYVTHNTETRNVSLIRTAPIIITNEYNEPLDISSSYRIYTTFNTDGSINYDEDRYVFTNTEREIFEPKRQINTTNDISSKLDTVKVFGIKAISIDYDNIYRVIRNENDVGLCCDYNYEQIDPSNITVNSQINEITINNIDVSQYTYLVIDYVKNDSYCINPDFENDIYEINISTDKTIQYYFSENESVMSDYTTIPFENSDEPYYLVVRNESGDTV